VKEFVVFFLGNKQYALPLSEVVEIFVPAPVYSVPSSKPFVLGLTNIRGNILPVVDLNFLLEEKHLSEQSQRYIWVRIGGEDFVILVDRVQGIRRIEEEEIKNPPDEMLDENGLKTMFLDGEDLVMVIDPLALVG
jgi:chemotaxis signal transduction protein